MSGAAGSSWERQHQAAMEHLPSPVVVVDHRAFPVIVNRAARHLLRIEAGTEAVLWDLLSDAAEEEGFRRRLQDAVQRGEATLVDQALDGQRTIRWRWTRVPASYGVDAISVGVGDVTETVPHRSPSNFESRLKGLMKVIPDLIFRLDDEGRFLEFYAANENMLYASPRDIVGHSLRDLLPDPVASESMACLRRALDSGCVQVHEYALPVAPGHRFFEARHVALGEREVLAIVRDVTDRKLAERALRDSEYQYRMLVERASEAIVICDPQGKLMTVNRQACRLFGREEADLLSMGMANLVPAELEQDVHHFFAGLHPGDTRRVERKVRKGDGAVVDVEVSVNVMPDGRVQGILRDVTERRRAEAALRRSERSFQTLIERTPARIAVHREGRIVWVNESCARAFQTTPEAAVGRPVLDFVHPDDRKMVMDRIRLQLETGEAAPPAEERFVRPDGSTWIAEVVAIPLEFQGEPSIIVIAHDVTERRRVEEERRVLQEKMQHAQKLESLGVLAGGIAHDFNNLLMGVLGNASLALLDLAPESPVRDTVKRIETAAHRAADLTKQLLAYSGKGRFVVQPLSLSKVVEEMVHLLETVISKKATLRFEFTPNLPLVEADATQLRQVVMNLITNASDALGEGEGVITVRTGTKEIDPDAFMGPFVADELERGLYAYLEVGDTGCGMDRDTQLKIFDPFYTTKFTGRGLGLAAVQGIVRGHRGAISVYSEKGRGTCFKVLLPVAVSSETVRTPSEPQEASWRGAGIVLVVDDEETVRTVAKMALERQGFEVLTANDGVEALEVYEANSQRICLVLLDMTMPRMGGEETLRELRSMNPEVKVMLSSGYNEQEAINRFAGQNLTGFIQKPYTPGELLERIGGTWRK